MHTLPLFTCSTRFHFMIQDLKEASHPTCVHIAIAGMCLAYSRCCIFPVNGCVSRWHHGFATILQIDRVVFDMSKTVRVNKSVWLLAPKTTEPMLLFYFPPSSHAFCSEFSSGDAELKHRPPERRAAKELGEERISSDFHRRIKPGVKSDCEIKIMLIHIVIFARDSRRIFALNL